MAPGVCGSDYFPFFQVTLLSLFSELLHLIVLIWCNVWAPSDAVSEHALPGMAIFHYCRSVFVFWETHDHRPQTPAAFANTGSVFYTVVCVISADEVCVQCLNHFIH